MANSSAALAITASPNHSATFFPPPPPSPGRAGRVPPSAVLTPAAMFALGVIGNAAAIVALAQTPRGRKDGAFYALVCGLAVTDLLGTCLSSPVVIAGYARGGWPGGDALCGFFSFTLLFFGAAGSSILCAMSVERYLAVNHAYAYSRHVDARRARAALAALYALNAALCALPAAGVGRSVAQFPGTWCFLDWRSREPAHAAYNYVYAGYSAALVGLTLCCNAAVCGALLRMRRRASGRRGRSARRSGAAAASARPAASSCSSARTETSRVSAGPSTTSSSSSVAAIGGTVRQTVWDGGDGGAGSRTPLPASPPAGRASPAGSPLHPVPSRTPPAPAEPVHRAETRETRRNGSEEPVEAREAGETRDAGREAAGPVGRGDGGLPGSSRRERWRRRGLRTLGPSAAEVQMMWLLLVMTLVFVVCSVPLVVRIFVNQLHRPPVERRIPHNRDILAIRLASFNPILDPWVYILCRRGLPGRLARLCRRLAARLAPRGGRDAR